MAELEAQVLEITGGSRMFLEFLNDGPRTGGEVKAEAKRRNISMRPVMYTAAKRLRVTFTRSATFQAGTEWRLPE